MNVRTRDDGSVELDLSLDELSWFGQSLNECGGGFAVKDYKGTIGVEREVAVRLLDQIVSMYPATLGDKN
jgi:hypothetical protein